MALTDARTARNALNRMSQGATVAATTSTARGCVASSVTGTNAATSGSATLNPTIQRTRQPDLTNYTRVVYNCSQADETRPETGAHRLFCFPKARAIVSYTGQQITAELSDT